MRVTAALLMAAALFDEPTVQKAIVAHGYRAQNSYDKHDAHAWGVAKVWDQRALENSGE